MSDDCIFDVFGLVFVYLAGRYNYCNLFVFLYIFVTNGGACI